MNILLDSDALFGLFVPHDAHHKTVKAIIKKNLIPQNSFRVLNLVIQETATLISYKINQEVSLSFLENFSTLATHIITLTEVIERNAWDIFKKQTKKGTSFIDCANLATVEYYKLDGILTFDEFYPQELRIK